MEIENNNRQIVEDETIEIKLNDVQRQKDQKTKKGTKYRVKVYIGKDYKGNPVRKGKAWNSLQEARIERAKLQGGKYTGEITPSSFVTNQDKLSVLIDYWLENNQHLPKNSLKRFNLYLGRLKNDMGKIRADAFTKPVFIKYMRDVFEKGVRNPSRVKKHLEHKNFVGDQYSPSSKHNHIQAIKTFFRDIVAEGRIQIL